MRFTHPTTPDRSGPAVALETTLPLHGVPRADARPLCRRLAAVIRAHGSTPLLTGVIHGTPVVGLSEADLDILLAAPPEHVPKLNTANLGPALVRRGHGATTVSTTMELAARAGVALFATGGVGGVHPPPAHYDVSADLTAFTRFPVAVVASGVKSILDLPATREHLETLGVCVVGFHTDDFPAFYLRCSPDAPPGAIRVDERFDDEAELAAFLRFELARANRGVLVCNPIPSEHEIDPADWKRWLTQAQARVTDAQSPGVPPARQATPALLAALHQISDGATLRANLALVESNAALAARLAVAMHTHPSP